MLQPKNNTSLASVLGGAMTAGMVQPYLENWTQDTWAQGLPQEYVRTITLTQPVFPWQGITNADAPVRMDMVTVAKTENVMARLRQIADTHDKMGQTTPQAVKLMIDRISTHCEPTIEVDDSLWSVLGGRL